MTVGRWFRRAVGGGGGGAGLALKSWCHGCEPGPARARCRRSGALRVPATGAAVSIGWPFTTMCWPAAAADRQAPLARVWPDPSLPRWLHRACGPPHTVAATGLQPHTEPTPIAAARRCSCPRRAQQRQQARPSAAHTHSGAPPIHTPYPRLPAPLLTGATTPRTQPTCASHLAAAPPGRRTPDGHHPHVCSARCAWSRRRWRERGWAGGHRLRRRRRPASHRGAGGGRGGGTATARASRHCRRRRPGRSGHLGGAGGPRCCRRRPDGCGGTPLVRTSAGGRGRGDGATGRRRRTGRSPGPRPGGWCHHHHLRAASCDVAGAGGATASPA